MSPEPRPALEAAIKAANQIIVAWGRDPQTGEMRNTRRLRDAIAGAVVAAAQEKALQLRAADAVMAAIDDAVGRHVLDARSPIADARLDYGMPHTAQAGARGEERLHALKAMLERLGQVHEIEGLMVGPLNLVDAVFADRVGAAGEERARAIEECAALVESMPITRPREIADRIRALLPPEAPQREVMGDERARDVGHLVAKPDGLHVVLDAGDGAARAMIRIWPPVDGAWPRHGPIVSRALEATWDTMIALLPPEAPGDA